MRGGGGHAQLGECGLAGVEKMELAVNAGAATTSARSWQEETPSPKKIVDLQQVFQQGPDHSVRIIALVLQSFRIADGEDRQAPWRIASANRGLQRIGTIVIAIVGAEYSHQRGE